MDISADFKGKKVGIIGFGREGRSTFEHLKFTCDEIVIFDRNYENIDLESLVKAGDKGEGNFDLNRYKTVSDKELKNYSYLDVFFKSPGVPLKNIEGDVDFSKLSSQTNEFLRKNKDKTIGVTGTKGKSTTSTMIYELLRAYGVKVELIGNIGVPCLEADEDSDYYVFEMSSHQLELVDFSPKYAILLNVYEEHLDHYKDFNHYKKAKENVYFYQNEGDFCFSFEQPKNLKSRFFDIGKIDVKAEGFLDLSGYKNVIGKHNKNNAYLAMLVTKGLGYFDLECIEKAFKGFKPLAHRLEYIGILEGVDYYDDSISTIPRACIAACESIENAKTIIIGGMDRGIDYSLLIDFIKERKDLNFIALPDTGHNIFKEIKTANIKSDNIQKAKDLKEAVSIAKSVSKKGEAVVLSPAAPSYGFFKNFEDRGEKFKEYVFSDK